MPTTSAGIELTTYSLRHTFATLAKEAGIPPEDRDLLMGHRRKSTKQLNYEVTRVGPLFEQIKKLPYPPAEGRNEPTAAAPLVPFLVSTAVPGLASTTRSIEKLAEEERFELPVGCPTAVFKRDAEWTPVDAGGRNPSTDVSNHAPRVGATSAAVQESPPDARARRELRRWRDVVTKAVERAEAGDHESALRLLRALLHSNT